MERPNSGRMTEEFGMLEEILQTPEPLSVSNLGILISLSQVSIRNQDFVRSNNKALKKIFEAVQSEITRPLALHLISFLSMESRVLQDLLVILQMCDATSSISSSIVSLRCDVLLTFCSIFQHDESAKDVFRSSGGLIWIASALEGIGQTCNSQFKEHVPPNYVLRYIQILIYCLGCALSNHPINQSYIRNEIRFITLFQTILSFEFLRDDVLIKITSPMFSVGLRNWPPSCSMHLRCYLAWPWEETSKSMSNELLDLESLKGCVACRDSIFLENPEMFNLMIHMIAGCAKENHSLKESQNLIQQISLIVSSSSENLCRLSHVRFVEYLFEEFWPVLQPTLVSVSPFSDFPLFKPLFELVRTILSNHLYVPELSHFVSLIRTAKGPCLDYLMQMLLDMTNQRLSPDYYSEFSKYALKHFDVSTTEGQFLWPPSKGYSISFWAQFLQLGSKTATEVTSIFFVGVSKDHCMECFISPKGFITLKTSDKDVALFSQFALPFNKWVFITLSHGIQKSSKTGIAKLYINAISRETHTLPLQKSVSGKKLTVRFSSPTFSFSDAWRLGNVMFFSDIPTEKELFLLYSLGPNYVGSLNINLQDHLNPSLWKKKSIAYCLSPRVFFSTNLRLHTKNNLGGSISEHMSIRNIINRLGGVSIALFLIVSLTGSAQLQAFRWLYYLIQNNCRNLSELKAIYGYEMIAALMKRKNNGFRLDRDVLEVIFRFVGLEWSSVSNSFSYGVITNIFALKTWLLDWSIWKSFDPSLTQLIYLSLADCLFDSTFGQINMDRLKDAGLSRHLFSLFKLHNDLPRELAPHIRKMLCKLMELVPNKRDFQFMVNYLVVSQSFPTTVIKLRIGPAPDIKNNAFPSIRSTVLSLLLEMLTLDGQFGGESMLKLSPNANFPKVIEMFSQQCSLEMLFAFLRTDSLRSRVILLKIIGLFLQHPPLMQKFESIQGFHLLCTQLETGPISHEIFSILFCFLFGKPAHLSTDHFFGTIRDDVKIVRPQAIVPILGILKSDDISEELRVFVLKTVHDLFLQNEKVKNVLLETGLIKLLCDVFAFGFIKKRLIILKMLQRNSPEKPKSSFFNSKESISENVLQISISEISKNEQNQEIKLSKNEQNQEIKLSKNEKNQEIKLSKNEQNQEIKLSKNEQNQEQNQEIKLSKNEQNQEIQISEIKNKISVTNLTKTQELVLLNFNQHVAIHGEDYSDPLAEKLNEDMLNEHIHWSAEQAVMFFLKDIGLHGCINTTTGITLPDDILLTLELLDLPGDYIKTIQQSMLSNVLKFFLENDFFKQLVVLSCNYACWENTSTKPISNEIERKIWFHFGLPSRSEWYCLLFQVLLNAKAKLGGNISNMVSFNHLSNFAILYALQAQFARLLLYLFSHELDKHFLVWMLDVMCQDEHLLLDLTTNEDFVVRFIFYSQKLLNHSDIRIYTKVWALWTSLYSFKPGFFKKVFIGPFSKIQDAKLLEVDKMALVEVQKAEDKDNWSEGDWLQSRRLANENKLSLIFKPIEKAKQSAQQLTFTALSMSQSQSKVFHDQIQQSMEKEKIIRREWKSLLKRISHQRAICPIENRTGLLKVDRIEGTNRMSPRLKYVTKPIPFLSTTPLSSPNFPSSNEDELLSPEDIMNFLQVRKNITFTSPVIKKPEENEPEKPEEDPDVENEDTFQKVRPGERLRYQTRCVRIKHDSKQFGDILIGKNFFYFIDDGLLKLQPTSTLFSFIIPILIENRSSSQEKRWRAPKNFVWDYADVKELHPRRYSLKNVALELFLINGKTYLLIFDNEQERDTVYNEILSSELPNRVNYQDEVGGNLIRMSLTERWKKGQISNFDYLMHLNTQAGRSFNDLTQYPVFPFILANYTKQDLDLQEPRNFRNLAHAMGNQDPDRAKKFLEKYEQLKEMGETPYHYGTHYSNIGTVLHFLVRLEPFTQYFLQFQGGKFDVPDRAFHSMEHTWNLSSRLSTSDMKELIPEFFYMPEFLENINKYDMGIRHDKQRIGDIVLPPWAKNSRDFIRKHREALESPHVSKTIHHWIDLIFGFQQSGEEAIKAMNVFHPLTYEGGVDVESIEDPVIRIARIAQINSYGQTPKQLWKKPHGQKIILPQNIIEDAIFTHPEKLTPFPLWSTRPDPVAFLSWLDDSPVALGSNKILLFPKGDHFLSWGFWDRSLRICQLSTGKVMSIIEMHQFDDTTLCSSTCRNGRIVATAGTACNIKVWKHLRVPTSNSGNSKGERLEFVAQLFGHQEAVECLVVSQEWSLILSGSRDRTCILWDFNRFSYVRSLSGHEGPVTAVAISPNTGDIVTVDQRQSSSGIQVESDDEDDDLFDLTEPSTDHRDTDSDTPLDTSSSSEKITILPKPQRVHRAPSRSNSLTRKNSLSPYGPHTPSSTSSTLYGSNLTLWSINGRKLASTSCKERINCVLFTSGMEGICRNVVITGLHTGAIKIWAAWDLTFLHRLEFHKHPITALTIPFNDHNQLISGDSKGFLVAWKTKDSNSLI